MSDDFEQFDLQHSAFGFSAQEVEELDSEYTVVDIAIDNSGSIAGLADAINKCLGMVITDLGKSPRADNLMVRLINFGGKVMEVHGYKLLRNCAPDDYKDAVTGDGGLTALNDAAVNAIESSNAYCKTLQDQDCEVNAILVVISDGLDNNSTNKTAQVMDAINRFKMNEHADGGLMTILIGCEHSYGNCLQELGDWQKATGFSQYEPLQDVKDSTFAKIANFISRSVSKQSIQLQSGGPSVALPFSDPGQQQAGGSLSF